MTRPKMRLWQEMSAADFRGDVSNWVAVLPLAAIEQHGPHLPVGVDAMIAEGLVSRSVAALDENSFATFLPVQTIGKSTEHENFKGTLSLGWQSSIQSLLDICEGLAATGIRKLVMVTSHGGNFSTMEIVGREMRQKHSMLAVSTSWEKLGSAGKEMAGDEVYTDIHGGKLETSLMLALRPELVKVDRAENFDSAQREMKEQNNHLGFHSSNANISWASEDLNPKGVVGDAASASAEQGEEIISRMVSGFVELLGEVETTSDFSS